MTDKPAPPAPRGQLFRGILVFVIGLAIILGIRVYLRVSGESRDAALASRQQEVQPIVTLAQKQVLADADLAAKLGEKPVTKEVSREGAGELDAATTIVHFNLVGSQGTAKVTTHAKQNDGNWLLTKIEATLSDGKTKEIPVPESDAPPELNFDTSSP